MNIAAFMFVAKLIKFVKDSVEINQLFLPTIHTYKHDQITGTGLRGRFKKKSTKID
jgi:hypothetical protein